MGQGGSDASHSTRCDKRLREQETMGQGGSDASRSTCCDKRLREVTGEWHSRIGVRIL